MYCGAFVACVPRPPQRKRLTCRFTSILNGDVRISRGCESFFKRQARHPVLLADVQPRSGFGTPPLA